MRLFTKPQPEKSPPEKSPPEKSPPEKSLPQKSLLEKSLFLLLRIYPPYSSKFAQNPSCAGRVAAERTAAKCGTERVIQPSTGGIADRGCGSSSRSYCCTRAERLTERLIRAAAVALEPNVLTNVLPELLLLHLSRSCYGTSYGSCCRCTGVERVAGRLTGASVVAPVLAERVDERLTGAAAVSLEPNVSRSILPGLLLLH
ncbi:hypothetical protein V494_00842 [Pseudogymnoascus sp. VKM F-4513 (FW-928)]|nr:hypothetical protein V494_00842 [Pseudogymnoascus sp. VKM F-4513 (FW-928)]